MFPLVILRPRDTLRGGWALTLSTFLQWDHVSSHADASLLELHRPSCLQTLGCSDRDQHHYQFRKEAWSCCCEAVAVAAMSKWRKHGKTLQQTSAPPLPQQISLAFLSFWQCSGFEPEHGKGGGVLCRVGRLRDAEGSKTVPFPLWTWEGHFHSWNGVQDAHISSTALLQCSYCQYPYYHTDLPKALEKSHSTNTTLYNVRMITSKAFVKSSNLSCLLVFPPSLSVFTKSTPTQWT